MVGPRENATKYFYFDQEFGFPNFGYYGHRKNVISELSKQKLLILKAKILTAKIYESYRSKLLLKKLN